MKTITIEVPDDLADDLLAMPEEERNRFAVAALRERRASTARPPRFDWEAARRRPLPAAGFAGEGTDGAAVSSAPCETHSP